MPLAAKPAKSAKVRFYDIGLTLLSPLSVAGHLARATKAQHVRRPSKQGFDSVGRGNSREVGEGSPEGPAEIGLADGENRPTSASFDL